MVKMVWKVANKMLKIFHHGNNKGYSLLDASIGLFIAGTTLLAVYALTSGLLSLTKKTATAITYIIQENNTNAKNEITLETKQ